MFGCARTSDTLCAASFSSARANPRRPATAPHLNRISGAPNARASESEFLFQDVVDRGRARFAARRLHYLADEPADRLRIGLGVGNLVRILGDDLVDRLFDRGN